MARQKFISISGTIILLLALINVIVIKQAYIASHTWYWALVISLPLLVMAISRPLQPTHDNHKHDKTKQYANHNQSIATYQ